MSSLFKSRNTELEMLQVLLPMFGCNDLYTCGPEWAIRTESYRTVHFPSDSVRLALDTIEREPNIPPVRYGTIYFASGIWRFGSVR